jgi:beta-aspartyl-peptidase (threonine type)
MTPAPPPPRSVLVVLGQLLLAGALALLVVLFAREARRASAVTQVRAAIQEQADAWNRGDLDGFMSTYADDVTFYAAANVVAGREALAARYRKRYQSEGKEMGQLTFSDVEVIPLDGDAVVARGRWKVQLKNDAPDGLFTILLRKLPGGWKIVHDHTSASEPPKKS